MEEFSGLFEEVEDPRRSNATRRDRHETPMIALLSMLCGGEGAAAARSPLHSGQAFSTEARSMPGQVRVEAKSNEITALPALKGRVVTADAMHTQRAMAEMVAARGGGPCAGAQGQPGDAVRRCETGPGRPGAGGQALVSQGCRRRTWPHRNLSAPVSPAPPTTSRGFRTSMTGRGLRPSAKSP